MLEILLEWDREFFLFLNGLHTSWLDPVMSFISGKIEWLPLYLLLIYIAIREYKWKTVWIIVFIAIAIALSDQITSGLMKPFFARLRPSRDPSLEGLVHLVNGYRGGMYGFASSHAANSFAIASFFYFQFKNSIKGISWLWLWAFVVSYSRIYLGVHYPLDIAIGGIIGIMAGFISQFTLHKSNLLSRP